MDKNWKQRNKNTLELQRIKCTQVMKCVIICVEKRGRITYLIYIFAFINKDLFAPREELALRKSIRKTSTITSLKLILNKVNRNAQFKINNTYF